MGGWAAIKNNTLYALHNQLNNVFRIQEQIGSGMRVIRASDDPGDGYLIMDLRAERETLSTYEQNLQNASFNMEHISSTLEEISTNLTRVKELTTQAASGTYNQSSRVAAGQEVNAILDNIFALVNNQTMGRYLFGGAELNTAPYSAERDNGEITNISYQGSEIKMEIPVAPNVNYPATFIGQEIFRSVGRGTPVFPAGLTGAAPGDGTPSARGDVVLTVSHTQTNYIDPSGLNLSAGVESPAGDTIVGAHTLTVAGAGANRTIRLDGGDAVAFTNETNLKLTNETGDVVYVDVSGFSGTNGTVTLSATGTLSIDGNTTTTVLDPANGNQAVEDDEGHVLFVDCTGITRTGAEPVRIPGSYDLFGTLIQVRDLMKNESGYNSEKQSELLSGALSSLDELLAGVTQTVTSAGARVQAMDALKNMLGNLKYNAQSQQSAMQDADVVELATELANFQTFYQMTLQSSSKLLSLSLLDFM